MLPGKIIQQEKQNAALAAVKHVKDGYIVGLGSGSTAAFAIEACFGFPTHMAATAVLGGLVAGHAVRGRADVRDTFAHCRDSIRGWYASVICADSRFPPEIGS